MFLLFVVIFRLGFLLSAPSEAFRPSTPHHSTQAPFVPLTSSQDSQMGSILRTLRTAANPYKVFIAGGCYSGLSAAVNLLERCDSVPHAQIPIDITIVDERDGFCMPHQPLISLFSLARPFQN
jgi:hypothetical protein